MTSTNLIELTEMIIEKYHNPLRENLPKLQLLLDKIVHVHGDIHPEFALIAKEFWNFKEEMLKHLYKEEKILFPMMKTLQKARDEGQKVWPFHCGSIQNPIAQMEHEHADFEEYLEKMNQLSNHFAIPGDACNAVTMTYTMLKHLYDETLEHANLENTVLHTIAIEMEQKSV